MLAREKGDIALGYNPDGKGKRAVTVMHPDRATMEELLGQGPSETPAATAPVTPRPFTAEAYNGMPARPCNLKRLRRVRPRDRWEPAMIAGPRVRLDDRQSFQKLKTVLHRRVVEAIDLTQFPARGEHDLRNDLQALAAHVLAADLAGLPPDVGERMVREILDEIDGFGPLEPLFADPTVSDIFVNGPDNVRVERNGLLEATEIRFADEAHLLRLIRRLVEEAGARIDERSPSVDVKLPDGARLTAVIAPLALRGPTLCLRRAVATRCGSRSSCAAAHWLPKCPSSWRPPSAGGSTSVISGGSASGKTTLLNNLARVIPRQQRIVTIEEDGGNLRSPSPTSFRSKRGESPSLRLDRQRHATYSNAPACGPTASCWATPAAAKCSTCSRR